MAPQPLAGVIVPANNVGNTFGVDVYMWRRMIEVGPRVFQQEIDTYRMVVGFDGGMDFLGDYFSDWTWETSVTYGRNSGIDRSHNYINLDRYDTALDSVACAAASADGCVHVNPFGLGNFGGSDADYFRYTDQAWGFNEQTTFAFYTNGTLLSLPSGDVGAAFGVEYREEEGSQTPDALSVSGVGSGNASKPTEGGYEVFEAFGEVAIPILSGIDGVNSLEVEIAGRYSDYSNFGNTSNFKVGLLYSPVEELMLRGVVSSAFRAPSIPEAYGGAGDSYLNTVDPCNFWDTAYAPTSNEYLNCQAAGLAPGFSQLNTQIRTTVGGNPALQPETADTLTVGLVWTPDYIPGFDLTIDYWKIEMDDYITSLTGSYILSQCYSGPVGLTNPFCAATSHTRDGAGQVDSLTSLLDNVASSNNEGVDIAFHYSRDLPISFLNLDGTFSLGGDFAHVINDQFALVGQPLGPDATGYTSSGVSYPEWAANLTSGYATENWNLLWDVRYIDGTQISGCYSLPPGDSCLSPDVEYMFYHDISARYTHGNWALRGGIDNLFDEEPPYVVDDFAVDANTATYDYDVLGRYYWVRVTRNF